MDEKRVPYSLKAPGTRGPGSSLQLPGRGSFPAIDDRLVEPEITRDEIIGGRRVVASPAKEPHATQHTELDYVVRAHVAPGYRVAADLLTRHDKESDFATDVCVFKAGTDPESGGRHLEEIAFELVSEQNERLATEKAVRMCRRGVRRIFTVWVKEQRVCEWSPDKQSWKALEAGAHIEDPCLVAPLALAALLDAAAADHAVVEALAAKGDPTIRQREAVAEARGKAAAKADAILEVLEARGVTIGETQRQEILRCQDLDRLDRWLRRASVASSGDEFTSEP